MGPWSNPVDTKPVHNRRWGSGEIILCVAILALFALGALGAWMSRYEVGMVGGLPTRLNRMTGQVIGCVPLKGCVELIPGGEPTLGTPTISHPAVAATAAPQTEAAQPKAVAPAAQPSHAQRAH